jgi:adenylate kinase
MSDELRIYFAAAVRGDASGALLARRIEQLSELGQVLTKHLASAKTIDMGHADDAAIHAHDQTLLAQAHVFVADLAAPSTGSGYMIARAIGLGVPVLCLFPHGTRASAMIAGSPDVTTRFYADDADVARHVQEFVLAHAAGLVGVRTRARRIFLAGPPGSGKGTLGARLGQLLGASHISTGELLRSMVGTQPNHPLSCAAKAYMEAGQLVPAEVMRDVVVDRLAQPDCQLLGCILDGYPPSLADLENLRGLLEPDLVLYLDVSDATAIARQVSRAARSTDTPARAKDRMAAFHSAHAEFDELATRWYPDRLVVRIDAERPAEAVAAQVLEVLRNTSVATRHERSYFPVPPMRPELVRSTRVHFHVDASDSDQLRTIAHAILARHKAAQGQMKIYPIRSLHLGGQMRLPIYRRLPNFHTIDNAAHEAFITGRLGDGDRALVRIVLEETRKRGGLAELEEYLGEWTLQRDGAIVAEATYELVALDHEYPEFVANLAPVLPTWELHHGFDVPKQPGDQDALPIALPELMAACAVAGLDHGGWFIFKNDAHWAYRSNEFGDGPQADATARVTTQAQALQDLLRARGIDVDISFSLERVHGIWTFPGHGATAR